MSSYQFQPAGIEDFDSDGDEFDFGGDDEIKKNVAPPGPPVNFTYEPQQRGGFGKPGLANGFAESDRQTQSQPALSRRGGLRNGASNRPANPTWTPQPVTSSTTDRKLDPVCVMDDLRLAINTQNINAVKKYLDEGVSPNTVFGTGWTALMYAVQAAQVEITEILLDKGADATYQKDMYTVLMVACSSKNESEERILQCVNKLIEKGAKVNDYDRHHVTALMCAARLGRACVIKRLVEGEVNLDKQDNKGWTALMWATQKDHRRVVDCLVEAGADVSKMASDGRKALDIATEHSRTECETLIRKYSPEEESQSRLITVVPAETGDTVSDTTADTNGPLVSQPQPSSTTMSRSSSTSNTTTQPVIESKTCTKWGEIEMFLSGIDLASLIPVFQQHQIQFEDFCRLQDKDLQQLGISQVGVRKRILDGVQATHKRPWQTSSLPTVQYNKKITCADAVAMMANINKHAKYVGSTVGYVSDQIQGDIAILREAQSGATVEDLVVNVEDSVTNVKHLFEELVVLRSHLNQVSKKNDFRPPDLLMYPRQKKSGSYRRLTVLLGLTGIGIVVWKADSILDTFTNLYNSLNR